MNVTGLIALASAGGLGVAVAILIALSTMRAHRRFDRSTETGVDPETAKVMAQVQADIDKGRRGY
jgi:hypothetical protein